MWLASGALPAWASMSQHHLHRSVLPLRPAVGVLRGKSGVDTKRGSTRTELPGCYFVQALAFWPGAESGGDLCSFLALPSYLCGSVPKGEFCLFQEVLLASWLWCSTVPSLLCGHGARCFLGPVKWLTGFLMLLKLLCFKQLLWISSWEFVRSRTGDYYPDRAITWTLKARRFD